MSGYRGGRRNNNNNNNNSNYFHHDDRGSGFNGRHVSFKQGFLPKGRNHNGRLRKFMDNGDCDMTVKVPQNMRYNPMATRRNAQDDNNTRRPMKRVPWQGSPSSWYEVTLSHGKKYPRQDLFNTIHQHIRPVPFVPFNIKTDSDDLTFYVDNEKLAEAIYKANFKIQMPDGWKIQMKVRPSMPLVEMNDTTKDTIRGVMSSLFDSTTQHLNLSRFHANEEFRRRDVFAPLNRQNVLQAVFQIIVDSVPNLRSLDLSNNMIFATEHFVMLKRNMPELKSLNLCKNKIRSLPALSCLQGVKLETLILDENPLCEEFHDQTAYVREVRKIFKSLRQLDRVDLPPPVDFGIEETQNKLPPSHDSFLCNPDGAAFTKQFLQQFFDMYDNQTSRDGLLEAYADHSQFSMTAYSSNYAVHMGRYLSESRNWKRVKFEKRSRLLHHGKVEIVRFLNTLPKTLHDLTTLSVDLLVYRPELMSLCVCGVYRETDNPETNKSNFKAFSRTFVLVPTGTGVSIVNDMLSVANATQTQISKAFQSTIASPSSSVPTSPQADPAIVPSNIVDNELSRKQEMVTTLAMQTGMNMLWAEKCLVETNWDFNSAMYAFTEFNKMGKIPDEAFNK